MGLSGTALFSLRSPGVISYKINRPPRLRWAIGMFPEVLNLACFAQRPEADYHYPYDCWLSSLLSFLPQVGAIIA